MGWEVLGGLPGRDTLDPSLCQPFHPFLLPWPFLHATGPSTSRLPSGPCVFGVFVICFLLFVLPLYLNLSGRKLTIEFEQLTYKEVFSIDLVPISS